MTIVEDLSSTQANTRRILIFGWGPLPFEEARMHYAPCARLWQLAQPLAFDGHEVSIVAVRMPGTAEPTPPREITRDGIRILRCEEEDLQRERVLRFIEDSRAEILIGATARPSAWAIPHVGDRPLWIDLFGDLMAEAQAREIVFPGEERLEAYRNLLAELLDAGDAFSTVSHAQALCLVGQLGLAGRLSAQLASQTTPDAGSGIENPLNCGIPIVNIPCTAPRTSSQTSVDDDSLDVPPDAFVVLSSGGFNTWVDVETLARGLESAMEKNPRLFFVATGGAIPGQDDRSFKRWQELLGQSRHRGRIFMPGFLPQQGLDAWIRRADLGLLCEKDILERRLGSSGRIAHWLGAGLPVLCTGLSELGRTIKSHNLGMNYLPGNAEDLAACLVELSSLPTSQLEQMAREARNYSRDKLSPETTTQALRTWVSRARRIQGSRARGSVRLVALLDRIDALEGELQDREEGIHKLQSELGDIHHSRMWAWWMRYLNLRHRFLRLMGLHSAPR